ncbi:MAG: hypothetical protein ACKPCM_20535 [Pseudanabaena sp.]
MITEVVVTQLQQWFGKPNSSITTVKPEPTIPTNQPYVNSEGVYILPTRTPEEQMQRNQALIALLDEWVEEGDAEEQPETYECLQQNLPENQQHSRPLQAA